MIVVDTGPIVAAAFGDDRDHERCVAEFARRRKARSPLFVPSFVAGEACYMLAKLGGVEVEADLLDGETGGDGPALVTGPGR